MVLSDNAITKLPGQLLSNLASLSHLLLDRNLLEDLPSSLFEANVSLTVLDLSHNRFSQIPEAVTQTLPDGALHQLQSLSLSGNLVDELGSFNMPSLWRLEVSDNKLQNLTGLNLAGMPGLQVNYIDYCSVHNVAKTINFQVLLENVAIKKLGFILRLSKWIVKIT